MVQPILPVTRSKKQAGMYYSAISRFYDLLSSGAEEQARDDALRRLGVRPGEKILEIGIGTGRGMRRILAGAGASGSVVGVDIAPGMLAAARKLIENAGCADRARMTLADGAGLPFRSGSFDAVFMGFTLELFDTPEIPAVLSECRRVLRSGGRMGVIAMGIARNPRWMSRLYAWSHRMFPVLVDCRPIDARSAAEAAGFAMLEFSRGSIFSLPVDIVVARR